MTTAHWRCLVPECGDHGSYTEPETKTDTSPAAKHGHATVTSLHPWVEAPATEETA